MGGVHTILCNRNPAANRHSLTMPVRRPHRLTGCTCCAVGRRREGRTRWEDNDEEESKECVDLRDINSDDWQGYTDADVEAMRMLDEESYDDYKQGGVLCYDTDD